MIVRVGLKESWAPKNWCFWTVVLEKTLESPLDCREIQPVHPKGDQSWVIGRTDAKVETLILWPADEKSWFIWKDPDVGKDWGQEEKGTTEDEMVGWHHRLDGHGFGWTPGIGDGQGGLACCGSWGCKESDTTDRLNWTCTSRGFPGVSVVNESLAGDTGDKDLISGLGRFPWRRKWQHTPVFLPGKSHGWRSLVGYSSWVRTESDTTEHTTQHKKCSSNLCCARVN